MSAPHPRAATSADGHAALKAGDCVSSGGRAQIHQIWTVANPSS